MKIFNTHVLYHSDDRDYIYIIKNLFLNYVEEHSRWHYAYHRFTIDFFLNGVISSETYNRGWHGIRLQYIDGIKKL